jgi:hypothetical protein
MRFNNAVDVSCRVVSVVTEEGGGRRDARTLCETFTTRDTVCAPNRPSVVVRGTSRRERATSRTAVGSYDRSIDRDGGFAWGRRGCDDDDDEWVVWSYDEFEFEFIEFIELVGNAQSASLEGGDGVGGVRGDVCVGKRGVGDG